MAVKTYIDTAFGPSTATGVSLNSRYPVLPPGEKGVLVGATTKAAVAKDEVINILSGSINEVVEKIGDATTAPEVFYGARQFCANGGRFLDVVCPTSVGAHLTTSEAITDAVLDAVAASDASLIMVPKPATWAADGYGHYASVAVDKAYVDLADASKECRQHYVIGLPVLLEVADAIDYVTDATFGINKVTAQASVWFPNAMLLSVGGGSVFEADFCTSQAGLMARLAREHPRGLAKAPAGIDYQFAGIQRLAKDLYNLSDTVKIALQTALINPIMSHNGIYAYGASTLKPGSDEPFRHVSISRQHSEIRQQVSLLSQKFIFDNTDDFTLGQLKLKVEAYLRSLQDSLKIKGSAVDVAVNSVNPSMVDVTVGWKPNFPVEFIFFTISVDVE